MQKDISASDDRVWVNPCTIMFYLSKNLGTTAYPTAEGKQVKNYVLYNLLLLGLRDKTLANKLIRNNEKAEKPNFHDSVRKLFAVTDDHVREETIEPFSGNVIMPIVWF